MKKNPTLRTLVILGILFLIVYAMADGIRYASITGIVLSATSLFALAISVLLYRKLAQLKEEEDE
jgi:hypothetical protein